MLAYVFWHWKRADVSAPDYEERLRQFHRALSDSPPPGFSQSAALALSGAPWANDGGDAYEDWYLVQDSAALDPLNAAAVSASRQLPHDEAAARAAGGAAGLYRLRAGQAVRTPNVALWFEKPVGWSYRKLFAELEPLTSNGAALWGRQMTLGPAREFCLHAAEALRLPHGIEAPTIALRSVFPERA
jgi:hypothetical protein